MHDKIYEIFESYLPGIAKDVEMWFPNGKGSIRLRKKNKEEFIFTYKNSKDWSFETVDSFLGNGPYKSRMFQGGK